MSEKIPNIWKFNNTPWNNARIKEKSQNKLESFELNENENIAYQYLWDIAKAVVAGIFTALKA